MHNLLSDFEMFKVDSIEKKTILDCYLEFTRFSSTLE